MTKPQPITRRLLRLKPAAEYLSLSTGTLRAMIQHGELPAVIREQGAPWLIDVEDLNRWIERSKVTL